MRIIAHIDLDAFFASVEEERHPWLKGKPVVVGVDPSSARGVVATANYAARAYGIRSAMPIRHAKALAEKAWETKRVQVYFITPRYSKYGHISKKVFNIVRTRVPVVEQVSVDEAYLDLTFAGSYKRAMSIAHSIRKDIDTHLGLAASFGIAQNKLLAKIATEHAKPDGVHVVYPSKVDSFLTPLPIQELPGIGKTTQKRCTAMGIYTIGDLQETSWEKLEEAFGISGIRLYQKAHGIGSDILRAHQSPRKSIGEEETYQEDIYGIRGITSNIDQIVSRVWRKMGEQGACAARTVTLKIRFSDFQTQSCQTTSSIPVANKKQLYALALKLVLPFTQQEKNPTCKKIRLLGISVSGLTYRL